jgi:transcriptional regulator with XRE-family HTH domain
VTPTKENRRNATKAQELRRAAGEWLRLLRENRGISQRELAKKVGAEYYTFISQLETGRGRVPPERYEAWAEALGVETKLFVRTLLQYYDPVTFAILFKELQPASPDAES